MQNNNVKDGDHEMEEKRDGSTTILDGNAIINKESIKVMAPVSRDIMELLENDFEITEKFSDMYFCHFYKTNMLLMMKKIKENVRKVQKMIILSLLVYQILW